MKINFQNPPKYLDEKMVYNILRDYKILNCEVLVRDDEATVDDLIDVIMKNHRTYIKVSLYKSRHLPFSRASANGAKHLQFLQLLLRLLFSGVTATY